MPEPKVVKKPQVKTAAMTNVRPKPAPTSTEVAGPEVAWLSAYGASPLTLAASAPEPRLTVSAPNDPSEREADRVAEQVNRAGGTAEDRNGRAVADDLSHTILHLATPGRHGEFLAPPIVGQALRSEGRPLDAAARARYEPALGHDFSGVRVHDGPLAANASRAIGARAFTVGRDVVLGAGVARSDTGDAGGVLAHELTHVAQQGAVGPSAAMTSPGIVQRQSGGFAPEATEAWEYFGKEHRRKSDPEFYEAALARAVGAAIDLSTKLEGAGPPKTEEEQERFDARFKSLVRLTALGKMAAHRAYIEGRRDDYVRRTSAETASPEVRSDTMRTIRLAADLIRELTGIREKLGGFYRQLGYVQSAVLREWIVDQDDIWGWLDKIVAATNEYRTNDIWAHLSDSIRSIPGLEVRDAAVNAIYPMAGYYQSWRSKQIDVLTLGLADLYQKFPFFSTLDAEEVAEGEYATDDALQKAVASGFAELIENVDEAIVKIGSGDIHPLNLPQAVQEASESLSTELQPAAKQAVWNHEVEEFWKVIKWTAFQIGVVFIPVAGPWLALAVGAYQVGGTLEDMLDRIAIASASESPESGMLGVGAPVTMDWVLLGVQAALTLLDLKVAVGDAKVRLQARTTARTPEAAPRSGEPPSGRGRTMAGTPEGAPRLAEPPTSRTPAPGKRYVEPGSPEYHRTMHEAWTARMSRGAAEAPAPAKTGAKIPRPNEPVSNPDVAYAGYQAELARTGRRVEVAVYRNVDTGEYVVRTGTAHQVSPPLSGRWEAALHFHPNPDNVLIYRLPAPADVYATWLSAFRAERPVGEFVEFARPDGTIGRTTFSASPDGPVTVDFLQPNGQVAPRQFRSVEEYAVAWGERTRYLDPEGADFEWVKQNTERYLRRMREAHGEIGGGRTMAGTPEPKVKQPADPFKDVVAGDKIGAGGNKDVFAIVGREEFVIAVLRKGPPEALDAELDLLMRLQARQLPTVEIVGKTTYQGRPAVVMKRYAIGSKNIVRTVEGKPRIVSREQGRLLNATSVRDLDAIEATLKQEEVRVNDLQFLIGEDGRVVIADPLNVEIGPGPSATNLRMIRLLRDVALGNLKAK